MIDYQQISNDNHFVEFIDQLIDYPINCASLTMVHRSRKIQSIMNQDASVCTCSIESVIVSLVLSLALSTLGKNFSRHFKTVFPENLVWRSGLCNWCWGCMQMCGAVLVRGTMKSLKCSPRLSTQHAALHYCA